MSIGFRIGAATDVGAQRDINQDSYAVGSTVAIVADGMGGHRGGEVASSLAASEMLAQFDQPDLSRLVTAVGQANRRILDAAAANPTLHGMGTTVVAMAVIEDPAASIGDEPSPADTVETETWLGVINVGDSRAYRLTGNVLEQLTDDHSLVETLVREGRLTPEQAKEHPQRNIVTRALGVLEDVDVDDFRFIPKIGDRYLLCSDGLFNEVEALEIATILATYADPQETANALVVAANAGGGRDNITTVVVDIVAPDQSAMPAAAQALASGDNIEGADPSVPDPTDDAVAAFDAPESSGAESKQRWSWRR
ncbi:MAG: PP2C family serine/threonine-protein phosphatase [Actinomycetota bacterium]